MATNHSRVTIEVKYNNIPKYQKNLLPEILAAMDHGVAVIESQAAADANYLTGALRASHYRITPLHDGYAASVAAFLRIKPGAAVSERPDVPEGSMVVGFSAGYAIFPHDGTHNVTANPFLRRAAEAHKQDLVDEVEQAVNKLTQRLSQ
jgi:hypothetical protein